MEELPPAPLPPQFAHATIRGPSVSGRWIAVDDDNCIVCAWDFLSQEWRAPISDVPFKVIDVEL